MSKFNINFNNADYSIDESALSTPALVLKSHLLTAMSGTGATINFGGESYNVDSTKLSNETSAFATYLATIAGEGLKVVVNGVEYSVDPNKVASAISEFEAVLSGLTNPKEPELTAGLYDANGVMLASWDELVNTYGVDFSHRPHHSVNSNTLLSKVISNNAELASGTKLIVDDTITAIGGYVFYNCTSLTSIEIPANVETIDLYAFSGCTSLKEFTIPEGVTTISQNAFQKCTSLENIELPASVTAISATSFVGCTSLAYNKYDNARYLGNDVNPYHALMVVPSSDITSCSIHENTKVIADLTFYGCRSLTSITFAGTMEQWNAIAKPVHWNGDIPATYVQCSDGQVAL